MKKIMTAVLSVIALLMSASAHGQAMLTAPEKTIEWTVTQEAKGENVSIIFTGKIIDGWHTYGTVSENGYPTSVEFSGLEGCSPAGDLYAISESTDYDGEEVFFGEVKFAIDMKMEAPEAKASGTITWMSCSDYTCAAPEYFEFDVPMTKAETAATASMSIPYVCAAPILAARIARMAVPHPISITTLPFTESSFFIRARHIM